MKTLIYRKVQYDELQLVSEINREEIVESIYYYENHDLILKNESYNIKGWNPQNLRRIIQSLYELYKQGGHFFGVFNDSKMIGIVALENKFIGRYEDQLQLVFLHVDSKYRDQGIGTNLMSMALNKAKELGAKKLYISATPSKHTIDFYLGLGSKLTSEVNKRLYEEEPDDIHLELKI